jgi:hypothetical protein
MAALSIHHRGCTSHAEQPRRGCHVLDVQRLPLRMIPQQQQQQLVRGAAARPSRWMKVVEVGWQPCLGFQVLKCMQLLHVLFC